MVFICWSTVIKLKQIYKWNKNKTIKPIKIHMNNCFNTMRWMMFFCWNKITRHNMAIILMLLHEHFWVWRVWVTMCFVAAQLSYHLHLFEVLSITNSTKCHDIIWLHLAQIHRLYIKLLLFFSHSPRTIQEALINTNNFTNTTAKI